LRRHRWRDTWRHAWFCNSAAHLLAGDGVKARQTPSFDRLPVATGAALIMVCVGLQVSLMHAIIRVTAADLHPFEIAFFRCFFGLLVLLPIVVRNGVGVFRTNRIPAHLLRTACQVVSMTAFFFGISQVQLAQASALMFTAPLFATVFAVFLLGEPLRSRRIVALFLGLVGMLIIVRPVDGSIDEGSLLILTAASTLGGMMIAIKSLSRTDSGVTITTLGTAMVLAVMTVPAIMVWQWPTAVQFVWLFTIGALGSLSHYMVAQAMKRADASALMPYDFTKLIWASVLGFVIFSELPSWWTLAGGSIIFASTVYVTYRESRVGGAGAASKARAADR
jgi:drug/metabolite transporter (DMT)-like permease